MTSFLHPYVLCCITCHNQDMEATQGPINRQVDEKAVVHIYNGILLRDKKNEILLLTTVWMDLEGIMLSEIKSVRDKYQMISLIWAT